MIRRGDVVMVEFPYTDAAQSKVRPAIVVLNDRDNQRLRKTVLAMITGNLRRKGDPSHLFLDPSADAFRGCGPRRSAPAGCVFHIGPELLTSTSGPGVVTFFSQLYP